MPQRADHPGKAWCYKHECHPDICFEFHRPDVMNASGTLTPEEHDAAIVAKHIRLQQENFRKGILSVKQKFAEAQKAAQNGAKKG